VRRQGRGQGGSSAIANRGRNLQADRRHRRDGGNAAQRFERTLGHQPDNLTGGAVSAAGNDFTGSKYNYQTSSFSIAGGMGNATLWRLDGADNGDYMAGGNSAHAFPRCGRPIHPGVFNAGCAGWNEGGRRGQHTHQSGTTSSTAMRSSSSATTLSTPQVSIRLLTTGCIRTNTERRPVGRCGYPLASPFSKRR